MNEEIKQAVKEHLVVELDKASDIGGSGIQVTLKWDGEEISSDYVELEVDELY